MSSKQLIKSSDDTVSTEILNVLKYNNKSMCIDSLATNKNISSSNKKYLKKLLLKLMHGHKVIQLDHGQWTATINVPSLIGRYSILRSGTGLVKPLEDKPSSKNKPKNKPSKAEINSSNVYVQPHLVADAWPGDLVRVAISSSHQKSNKRIQGYIVEVIEKKQNTCVVEVEFFTQNYFLCKSTDPRLKAQFQVDASALSPPPQVKELLEVTIIDRLSQNLWTAQAITNFGREDNVRAQENLVKLNHFVPDVFPNDVLEEIEKLAQDPSDEDISARTDMRHIPFVTIDGETAKDFDDAIHVEKIANSFLLRVAIADVTHYVQPNFALDKEAQVRGNSWYFPTSVEPMLPHELSSGLCSLKPNKNRLTIVAEINFSEAGNIINYNFYSAVICSVARLTYAEVEQVVNQEVPDNSNLKNLPQQLEIISMLGIASQLAKNLIDLRSKRGALDFDLPEPQYSFSSNNTILNLSQKERLFSHKLIEEFMVATNEVVAAALTKNKIPFLYRVHPAPAADKLSDFLSTVQATGLLINQDDEPSLAEILKSVKDNPKEFLISRLALRTMAQARYQPENEGHFGLASESYCHFTSPIRRYADIVVHRALKYMLGLSKEAIPTDHKLFILADSINRLERSAMEAEREISRRLGVLFLKNHVGKSFDGIIASLTDFGMFIELDEIPVTGMIHLSELSDDFYEYRPEKQELIGIRRGIIYSLGQKVHVFVKDININKLEINFAFNDNAKTVNKNSKPSKKELAKKARPFKNNKDSGKKSRPSRKNNESSKKAKPFNRTDESSKKAKPFNKTDESSKKAKPFKKTDESSKKAKPFKKKLRDKNKHNTKKTQLNKKDNETQN